MRGAQTNAQTFSLSLSFFFFFWAAHKQAHFTDSHRPEYERRPVRSDPHWLKLSTVRSSRLRLTVSLEATAATNNRRLALPFSLLTAPTVYKTWQLSVLTCCYWRASNTGACASVPNQFGNDDRFSFFFLLFFKCPQIPFTSRPCLSSCFPAALSHSRSVCCRGPVGRGLIPSAWGFCQSLVPFCVMVLTERTPHLTPIELWGWAAGRPARANAAPCSAW